MPSYMGVLGGGEFNHNLSLLSIESDLLRELDFTEIKHLAKFPSPDETS